MGAHWLAPVALAVALHVLPERTSVSVSTSPPQPPPKKKPKTPPPLPKSNGKPAAWKRLQGPRVTLKPRATYAAVLHLTGFEIFASDGQVVDRLRALAPWSTLRVWSDPKETPAAFPGSKADAHGRRWALGQFAGAAPRAVTLPGEVSELYELS